MTSPVRGRRLALPRLVPASPDPQVSPWQGDPVLSLLSYARSRPKLDDFGELFPGQTFARLPCVTRRGALPTMAQGRLPEAEALRFLMTCTDFWFFNYVDGFLPPGPLAELVDSGEVKTEPFEGDHTRGVAWVDRPGRSAFVGHLQWLMKLAGALAELNV